MLKRKKEEQPGGDEKKPMSQEEVHELVYDIESVRRAIETCIEYEKATGIQLISKHGRIEFSKEYRKEEKKNRVKEMIRDEVQKQITPLNIKLDKLIDALTKPKKDYNLDETHKTIDNIPPIGKK
jgi:hypothetical protein